MRTSLAGLTRSPPTWTCPPSTASVAALRVLKKRAAQSHLSIRTCSTGLSSQRMDELTQLTADLVAIDSVNPALVPGGNGERDVALFVAAWCEGRGFEVELVGEERPSVVATRRGSGGGRSLLLNSHLDTFGVAGMAASHSLSVYNCRLHGAG